MADVLKNQLKELIVSALMIEDLAPADIENAAPLFGEGLGLDSVDALELAMEIERVFGVTLPEAEESREIFNSVDTLAAHIAENQPSA